MQLELAALEGGPRARARPQRARRLGARRSRRSTSRRRGGSASTRRSTCRSSPAAEPIGVVDRPRQASGRRPRSRDDDLRLAETLAARAAVAVDLSERVSRDAVRRVVEAQELERRAARARAARRDRPGADVDPARPEAARAGGRRPTRRAPRSRPVRELVVSTLQDVRRARGRAAPVGARRLRARAGGRAARRDVPASRRASQVDLEAQLGDERLPAEVETALYRIVQEALTNIVKHAGATPRQHPARAQGRLASPPSVEDDGAGFDPAAARRGRPRARRHARAGRARRRAAAGRVGARGRARRSSAEVPRAGDDPRPRRRRPRRRPQPACAACSTRRPTSRPSARRRTPSARSSRRSSTSPTSC